MRYLLIFLMGLSFSSFADDAQMRLTLSKIVDQIHAIYPLIEKAKAEQSNNPRYRIRFNRWVDAQGVKHNGLRDDLEAIQASLLMAINQKSVDPRAIEPIKGDFVGGQSNV